MFIVRLAVLVFLTVLSAVLSQSSSLFAMLFFLFAILLYFYPMYEAYIQKQPDFYSIFALNLFLGWSLIGWVVALVWAIKSVEPVKVTHTDTAPAPAPAPAPASIKPQKQTKQCPFCAEDILLAAIKCKHCSSEIH